MAIKVATWNIEGRLTLYAGGKGRGTPKTILDRIAQFDADIVVLPEAFLDQPEVYVDDTLARLHYSWYDVAYHDTLHDEDIARWGHLFMRVLYRIPIERIETIRFGDIRDLPVMVVKDPATEQEVCILPVHLDDMTEERRLQQVDAITKYLATINMPVVMLGDFNAIWRRGWQKLLASKWVDWLTRYVPYRGLGSMFVRASRMAKGSALELLKDRLNIRETDSRYRGTVTPKRRDAPYLPSIRLLQIDHILVSQDLEAAAPIIGADGGSDHRSLQTVIEIPSVQKFKSTL